MLFCRWQLKPQHPNRSRRNRTSASVHPLLHVIATAIYSSNYRATAHHRSSSLGPTRCHCQPCRFPLPRNHLTPDFSHPSINPAQCRRCPAERQTATNIKPLFTLDDRAHSGTGIQVCKFYYILIYIHLQSAATTKTTTKNLRRTAQKLGSCFACFAGRLPGYRHLLGIALEKCASRPVTSRSRCSRCPSHTHTLGESCAFSTTEPKG